MEEEYRQLYIVLGRIEAKVEEISSLKDRVTKLEDSENRRQGQIGGAKIIFEILKMLPLSVVGYLLGKN